jgi:hypothetical protein
MKGILSLLLGVFLSESLTFGQAAFSAEMINGPVQSGFVVITPISGGGQGLSVSELFANRSGNNLVQTTVLPSPLVTNTAVVVSSDPFAGVNTGIAIVNPTDTPATMVVTLRDQRGFDVASRSILIASRQQISQFVTEMFAGEAALAAPTTGLLFASSDVPVTMLALAFNGNTFTSLPVASQLDPNGLTAVTPASAFTPSPQTNFVTGAPASTFTIPLGTFTTPLPSTFIGSPTAISVTSTGAAVAGTIGNPQPIIIPNTILTPQAFTASTLAPTLTPMTITQNVASSAVTTVPQTGAVISNTGIMLLPQFAVGDGWISQVTIANTSPFAQAVRVDFFDANGGPFPLTFGSTLDNVVIPAGGVVVF